MAKLLLNDRLGRLLFVLVVSWPSVLLILPCTGYADLDDDVTVDPTPGPAGPKSPSTAPPVEGGDANEQTQKNGEWQAPEDSRQPRPSDEGRGKTKVREAGKTGAGNPVSGSGLDRVKKPSGRTPKDQSTRLPVAFKSDGLKGTRKDGIIELQRNVVVTQGDFRMIADEAEVIFDQKTEEVDQVIARGNVRITKKDPKTGEMVNARGESVTFQAAKEVAILSGNARFSRGADLVRGKTITYDMKTGWLNAEKVDGIVQPATDKRAK